MHLAVEAACSVVVSYECYDFHIFDNDIEVADFFRKLVAESHFVFVVGSENEFLSPSASESSTDGVVVRVVVATFYLECFDVRLSEPYVDACVRESLDGFAADGHGELAIGFVVGVSDVDVERSDRFERFGEDIFGEEWSCIVVDATNNRSRIFGVGNIAVDHDSRREFWLRVEEVGVFFTFVDSESVGAKAFVVSDFDRASFECSASSFDDFGTIRASRARLSCEFFDKHFALVAACIDFLVDGVCVVVDDFVGHFASRYFYVKRVVAFGSWCFEVGDIDCVSHTIPQVEVVEVEVVGLSVVGVFNKYLVDGAHAIVEYVEFHVVLRVDREFFADFDVCDFDVGLRFLAIIATCDNGLDAKFAFVAIATHIGEKLPFVVFGAIVVDVHTHSFRVELEFATFHAEHSAV